MGKRCVAKGAREAARDSNKRERPKDAARWDNRRNGGVAGRRGIEIDSAYDGGENGLDGVEEDGEVPDLRGVGGTIWLGSELFLKICPSEAIRDGCISDFAMRAVGAEPTMKHRFPRRR